MAIDYKPEQNDYTNLTPFKTWLVNQINSWGVNNFPFLEGDFDKLTNYGMLMKMMKCLNDIISNENLVEDDMSNLFNAFTELQNYINNYFENLDVQEEINTKLDEMAEDGSLYAVINRFIEPTINEINETLGEQNNRLDVMDARINEITSLPDGSTSGDAELQDIRIGFDGTTYQSAGDSVRGQIDFALEQIRKKDNYKRVQVLTQSTTTNYKDIFLPNHRYFIMYGTRRFTTTGVLYETPEYNSSEPTNTRLWNLDHPENIIIEPKNMYRSLRIWNDVHDENPVPVNSIYVYDITEGIEFENTCTEIPLLFNNGGLNDGGAVTDAAHNKIFVPNIPLKGLYLVTFPDDIYCRMVLPLENYTTPRKVISYYHPCSAIKDENYNFQICFGYKDNSSLRKTDSIVSNIHIYCIENKSSEFDVIIASSDTPTNLKEKADIIVTNNNSNEILASVFGCDNNIKALLLDGNYTIDKFYTMEDGSHCSLPLVKNGTLQYRDTLARRTIEVTGREMTTPQQINNVKLNVSEACHNAVQNNEYFIMGTPYRNNAQIERFHTAVKFKNFNIIGWLYDKPLTYVDLSSCLSVELESVNIRSWHEHLETYTAFDDTPNTECTGIRVGRGNQYGIQNYAKNLNVWYCGKGFVCNGEHFVLEDVKTHHDYIGFYFGDKYTVGRMQHPNVMIGCSIESCYRFAVLTKGGITTEQNYPGASDATGIFHSTLVMIGTSTENRWDIPTNERVEGQPTSQNTLPILEIIKNCYRGRIEIDEANPIFESGSGNGFIVYRYTGERLVITKGSNVYE